MGGLVRSLPRPRVPSLPAWRNLRRRLLIVVLLALALGAAYIFWLRDSSLVAVEQVKVVGAEQNPSVDSALQGAGLEQSTLHVDLAALEAAVASDPAVRSLSAEADFPHGLQITVDLREPVGYLKGSDLLIAGDGVILDRDTSGSASVPSIAVKGDDLVGGGKVQGEALEASRVLGAAPAPLLAAIKRASLDPESGVIVELDGGLELRFGGAGQADLKWKAAAAVLAQPSFSGAAYLDLSVPDRPVAGGVPDEEAAVDPALEAPIAAVPEVVPPVVEPAPVTPEVAPEVAPVVP